MKYTNIIDRRNSNSLPTKGGYLKTSLELAGFGGDVRFFRFNSDYQYSRTFFKYFVSKIYMFIFVRLIKINFIIRQHSFHFQMDS
jgi:outer membrane protein assembly factor BamA